MLSSYPRHLWKNFGSLRDQIVTKYCVPDIVASGDASCQNEPLPDSVVRVLSTTFINKFVPWAATDDVPSVSALAITLGVGESN